MAKWEPLFGDQARVEIDRIRAELVERYGAERAHKMCEVNRNLIIYPNLIINDIMAVTVRTMFSPAPDRVDVTAWGAGPKMSRRPCATGGSTASLTFLGPGGVATPTTSKRSNPASRASSGGVEWNDHLPRHGPRSDGQR